MNIFQEVSRNGYAFIERFYPDCSSNEIFSLIGKIAILPEGRTVHPLTPSKKENAQPNTYSGIYGYEVFPMHTDLAHWHIPPRYLALRCIVGFKDVETSVIDGRFIIQKIGENILYNALVQPRRHINGSLPLLRLYQKYKYEIDLFRLDEKFIIPASQAGVTGMNCVKECLLNFDMTNIQLQSLGDILIVDNWRMLHRRSAIPLNCLERIIERAYMENLN